MAPSPRKMAPSPKRDGAIFQGDGPFWTKLPRLGNGGDGAISGMGSGKWPRWVRGRFVRDSPVPLNNGPVSEKARGLSARSLRDAFHAEHPITPACSLQGAGWLLPLCEFCRGDATFVKK
eukprot:gene17232-biopygen8919